MLVINSYFYDLNKMFFQFLATFPSEKFAQFVAVISESFVVDFGFLSFNLLATHPTVANFSIWFFFYII